MEDNLLVLYCVVDDFCKEFYPVWESHLLSEGLKKRRRKTQLSPSEIMSLVIYFQLSGFRNFKIYYMNYVNKQLKEVFPTLVSYSHFVNLMKSILVPLCIFTQCLKGEKTGIYFIDSLLLMVNALLSANACPLVKDNYGKTPLDYAKEHGYIHVELALLNKVNPDIKKILASTLDNYCNFFTENSDCSVTSTTNEEHLTPVISKK